MPTKIKVGDRENRHEPPKRSGAPIFRQQLKGDGNEHRQCVKSNQPRLIGGGPMMLLDCVVQPIQGPALDDGRQQYERQADLGEGRTARIFHETTPDFADLEQTISGAIVANPWELRRSRRAAHFRQTMPRLPDYFRAGSALISCSASVLI